MTDKTKPQIDWIQYNNCMGCIGYGAHGTYEVLYSDEHASWDAKFCNTAIDQWGLTLPFAEKERAVNFCQAHADKLHDAEQSWFSEAIPAALPPEMPQQPTKHYVYYDVDVKAQRKLFELWHPARFGFSIESYKLQENGKYHSLQFNIDFESWCACAGAQRGVQLEQRLLKASPEPVQLDIEAERAMFEAHHRKMNAFKTHNFTTFTGNHGEIFDDLDIQDRFQTWLACARVQRSAQPAEPKIFAGADVLSQYIREIDGNHRMGAGALAEKIIDRFGTQPAPQALEVPPLVWKKYDIESQQAISPFGTYNIFNYDRPYNKCTLDQRPNWQVSADIYRGKIGEQTTAEIEVIAQADYTKRALALLAPQPCPAPAPKVAALPPVDPDSPDLDESIDVVVRLLDGFHKVDYYNYKHSRWESEFSGDKSRAREWWLIPEPGTGTPVPKTNKEIKL